MLQSDVKSELDKRIGRLKVETPMQESVLSLPHSIQFSAMMQTHIPDLEPTVVTPEAVGLQDPSLSRAH